MLKAQMKATRETKPYLGPDMADTYRQRIRGSLRF
jgi:hypothetical protein